MQALQHTTGLHHAMHSAISRWCFAPFVYAYYLWRHGAKLAAEMDLLDLFASLERHKSHARISCFLRFANADVPFLRVSPHASNKAHHNHNTTPRHASQSAAAASKLQTEVEEEEDDAEAEVEEEKTTQPLTAAAALSGNERALRVLQTPSAAQKQLSVPPASAGSGMSGGNNILRPATGGTKGAGNSAAAAPAPTTRPGPNPSSKEFMMELGIGLEGMCLVFVLSFVVLPQMSASLFAGGMSLTARALEFYSTFLEAARALGFGPLHELSSAPAAAGSSGTGQSNNFDADGICWVLSRAVLELMERVFELFPVAAREEGKARIEQLQIKKHTIKTLQCMSYGLWLCIMLNSSWADGLFFGICV